MKKREFVLIEHYFTNDEIKRSNEQGQRLFWVMSSIRLEITTVKITIIIILANCIIRLKLSNARQIKMAMVLSFSQTQVLSFRVRNLSSRTPAYLFK